MHRSGCNAIATASGTLRTLDPALVSVPAAKCANCEKRIELAEIVWRIIDDATTGEIALPRAGSYRVVMNRADDGTPLSIQIMLAG